MTVCVSLAGGGALPEVSGVGGWGGLSLTCVDPLPAHGEGGPRLNEVAGDGAAVVTAAAPGQLGSAVGHLLHRHRVRGARWAWHILETGKRKGGGTPVRCSSHAGRHRAGKRVQVCSQNAAGKK